VAFDFLQTFLAAKFRRLRRVATVDAEKK